MRSAGASYTIYQSVLKYVFTIPRLLCILASKISILLRKLIMPANKNAIIRYMFLDKMLSDRNHYYTRKDLYEKCNEKLLEAGFQEVTKRTIEKDLINIQEEPFRMDIDDYTSVQGKRIIKYRDQTRSLFSIPMSEDEKKLLKEVLNTLGQFSGLDNFTWLEDLQSKLNAAESFGNRKYDITSLQKSKIISFSTNEFLKNKESLGWFFTAISNRNTVRVKYRKFGDDKPCEATVCPYLLKQYNDRWYLICNFTNYSSPEYNPEFLMNLPLDRIESYEIAYGTEFREYPVDIEEHFQEVIGITYRYDRTVERILFCTTLKNSYYLDTKPIHGSQTRLSKVEQVSLKEKYPYFKEWVFYTIECIPDDYELPRLLKSFGCELVVLSPEHLRKLIMTELNAQIDVYNNM